MFAGCSPFLTGTRIIDFGVYIRTSNSPTVASLQKHTFLSSPVTRFHYVLFLKTKEINTFYQCFQHKVCSKKYGFLLQNFIGEKYAITPIYVIWCAMHN